MEKNNPQSILLFENARQVVKAEKILTQNALHPTIIAVPQQYSTECGLCITLPKEEIEQGTEKLSSIQISFKKYDK